MANALNEDITGKHVVIKETFFQPQYRDIKFRVFVPHTGFGCVPYTAGTGVMGTSPYDGDKFRVEGYDIERYATDEEIKLVTQKEAGDG